MFSLEFYKVHKDIPLPKFGTLESACFDLAFSRKCKETYQVYNKWNVNTERYFNGFDEVVIYPYERVMVPTGLIMNIPKGYSVRIHPRSGLSLKSGLALANQEGVIDSDFTDEVFILLQSFTENPQIIREGDRIAQGEMVQSVIYNITERLNKPKQRGDRKGGYGSTGVK